MQTKNSLEKRLENLEKGKEEEDEPQKVFLIDAYAGEKYQESVEYVLDRCEAACEDKKTYYKALGDALALLSGENPLEKEGISFVHISHEIALKTVENLRAAGIEVDIETEESEERK